MRDNTRAATPSEAPAVSAPLARPRTWPAVLLLLLLPGVTAETLTASTPIITYLTNPFSFLSNTLLYGSAAIVIRELTRRRGLGWSGILVLGAAFGVFEEGLVVNTWANPWLPQVCQIASGTATGLCDYSRVAGINLAWAASTLVFHAVISISAPILLVELLFPHVAGRPWLGPKAPVTFVVAELLVLALGVSTNITSFQQRGLPGPFAEPYLIEIALMAFLIVLAFALAPAGRAAHQSNGRHAPWLWLLRVVGFVALLADVMLPIAFANANLPYQLELAANGMLLILVIWLVATWSRRADWNERHVLALASGALGFFLLVWDPIFELAGTAGGGSTHGTALVALAYVVFLIILARHVAQRAQATDGAQLSAPLAMPLDGSGRDAAGG